jgi:hypothetical protein
MLLISCRIKLVLAGVTGRDTNSILVIVHAVLRLRVETTDAHVSSLGTMAGWLGFRANSGFQSISSGHSVVVVVALNPKCARS